MNRTKVIIDKAIDGLLAKEDEFSDYETEKRYNEWINSNLLSSYDRSILSSLTYEEKIKRFSQTLKFGTAGIRGIMEMGSNRFNQYTLWHAVDSFITVLKKHGIGHYTIIVSYDTRDGSKFFADTVVDCARNRGMDVAIFNHPTSTPVLSYAIRATGSKSVGINITASHNPKEYNGCKFYWSDGLQISESICREVEEEMNKYSCLYINNSYTGFKPAFHTADFILASDDGDDVRSKTIIDAFKHRVLYQCPLYDCYPTLEHINVTYTALHGTGAEIIPDVLISRPLVLNTVRAQNSPDTSFSSVNGIPNPENPESFKYAIDIAKKSCSDIIIATDPDCDRVGVMAKNKHGYYNYLSANKIATLLFKFMIDTQEIDKNSSKYKYIVAKSYVSTPMINHMAKQHGITCLDTEVGFRNIIECRDECFARHDKFLLGFEESCGYITGNYCGDKDAVLASLLICDMTAYYKTHGYDLFEALDYIYTNYGIYFSDLTIPIDFSKCESYGEDENEFTRMDRVIEYFSNIDENPQIGDTTWELSKSSNSIRLECKYDRSEKIFIRKSGTEPKMKLYIHMCGKNIDEAESRAYKYKELLEDMIESASVLGG